MKSILFGLLLALSSAAHAATCSIPSGSSSSAIQSALNSCGSGNTASFTGTNSINTQITLPCGVSLTGPIVVGLLQGVQTPQQTATINGSVGNGTAVKTTAGCTVPQSIQYVNWYGGRPNPGGNFIEVVPGTNHLLIANNYIHGNNCGAYCGSTNANLVLLDSGHNAATPTNDITILWNTFSAPGDCGSGAIVESQNPDTEGGGGFCNGIGMGGYLSNITIIGNRFLTGDNEIKYYEAHGSQGNGECLNCIIEYNDLQQYDRIGMEFQANQGGPSMPTSMTIDYNSFHNLLNPHQQDFDISAANGCAYGENTTGMLNCGTYVDFNMTVADTPAVGCGSVGYEFWGGEGSHANGNFWSGAYNCHTIMYAPSGHFTFNNNTAYTGGSATCGINNLGSEDSPALSPSCSGNVNGPATGTITSVAPVLSVSGSTVTIYNTNVSTPNGSNPGRDSNTTFWCRQDGTNPAPGDGVSVPYWVGAASQTVATVTGVSGTFKCVGMWGAPNQPFSYHTGLGYVPSVVVTASGTVTPPPPPPAVTLVSSWMQSLPTDNLNTLTAGTGSIQLFLTGTFSDGSTAPITTGIVWGTVKTGILAVSSSGVVTGIGAGQDNVTATIGTVQSSQWTVNVAAAPIPTLVSAIMVSAPTANLNQLVVGQAGIQLSVQGTFSDGSVAPVTAGIVWGTTGSQIAVDGNGMVTGVAVGQANVTAQMGAIPASQWTMFVAAPPPPPAPVCTSVQTGSTLVVTCTGVI